MKNQHIYLNDIIEAMNKIEIFIKTLTFDEFQKDDKTSSAVIRKFEINGEATKNINDDIRKNYPEIPWKEMTGMRDKLIHSYFGIDYKLVWTTIKDSLPKTKTLLIKILEDRKSTPSAK
ncbi:hypothetical protein LCGC14_1673660 [marine sediment metagenome]|uniref:DUF86 domain-containing protein n=1 Tax=marine sediment metagenome TaxID=412755 RepID=A0A0F9KQF1_9ZZZZ